MALVPFAAGQAAAYLPYIANAYGTGVGAFNTYKRYKKDFKVLADEARPYLKAIKGLKKFKKGKSSSRSKSTFVPVNRPSTMVRVVNSNFSGSYKPLAFTPNKNLKYKFSGNYPTALVPVKNYLVLGDNDAVTENTRTLYTTALAYIPKQTTADEQNLRDGNKVTIKGFAINIRFDNLSHDAGLYINVAIVIPRQSSAVSASEFFRDWGIERWLDFATGWSSEVTNRPINTDKYEVIMHRRYLLNQANEVSVGTGNFPNAPSGVRLQMYSKVNRAFTYDGTSGNTKEALPYLIHWCDQQRAASGSAAVNDVLRIHRTVKIVYREV